MSSAHVACRINATQQTYPKIQGLMQVKLEIMIRLIRICGIYQLYDFAAPMSLVLQLRINQGDCPRLL
jgi:hypothetical protein